MCKIQGTLCRKRFPSRLMLHKIQTLEIGQPHLFLLSRDFLSQILHLLKEGVKVNTQWKMDIIDLW